MSGKYSGLPDIDSAPDVFETPDEPELTHRREDENEEESRKAAVPGTSNEIDTGGLPSRRQVDSKFGSSRKTDAVSLPKETPLARLRRLQAEAAQLEQEISSNPDALAAGTSEAKSPPKRRTVLPSRQRVDMVTELSLLKEKLSGLSGGELGGPTSQQTVDWQARLQQLEKAEVEGSSPVKASPQPSANAVHAGDIDRRLASLEQQIGVTESGEAATSLVDTIHRMDHVLNVLTQPRQLDSIARRVKLLLVDLDRASAASRRVSGAVTADRSASTPAPNIDQEALQSLFALLPRLDPLIPIIPPLLARLRSLSTLHAEALGVAADLRELQSADRNVTEEEHELRSIVSGVQQGITESLSGIANNWEAVQGRIKALEERVASLDK